MSTFRFGRQEHHANGILAGGRQFNFQLLAFESQEPMRNLQKNSGSITSILFATTGAAMLEIQQDLNCFFDDAVGLSPLNVHDKAGTAGIMLLPRIVQALLFGIVLPLHCGGTSVTIEPGSECTKAT